MVFIIFTIFLLVPYVLLLLYYRHNWVSMPEFKIQQDSKEGLPRITVVIVARNEAACIGDCLRSVMTQQYPAALYEVIVVDDHSTDETPAIVKAFALTNLRLISLADHTGGERINAFKKKAIEVAMQNASGELIVTTDADCRVPAQWLLALASFYKEKNCAFIAAPVIFEIPANATFAGRFFQLFQSLDFMTLQGITGASVHKHFHNMCNGANLAYPKKVFESVDGFKNIDDLASGDDMLLMHKVQAKYPRQIGYLKSDDAIVETKPATSLSEFLNQRIRWASKSARYTDFKIIMVLCLVYVLNVWMLTLAAASFFYSAAALLLLLAFILKILFELIFLWPVAAFFKRKQWLWWFIPAQPFHIIYTVLAGGLGFFGKYQWKGRSVR